jgi:hypothetical protein
MALGQFLTVIFSTLMCFLGGRHIAIFIGISMLTAFATALYSGFGMSYIMYLYGGIPAICNFLACFFNQFFYKIDDKEAALYSRENRERETAGAAT